MVVTKNTSSATNNANVQLYKRRNGEESQTQEIVWRSSTSHACQWTSHSMGQWHDHLGAVIINLQQVTYVMNANVLNFTNIMQTSCSRLHHSLPNQPANMPIPPIPKPNELPSAVNPHNGQPAAMQRNIAATAPQSNQKRSHPHNDL